jgi:two-component system cell cycle sensor histidine kinase/response regulator CckA
MTLVRLALAVALSLSGLVPAHAQEAAAAKEPFVVYGDAMFPPLSFIDNGRANGHDVEIAAAVAARMGRPLRLELMDWPDALRRVAAGEGHAVLSLPYSAERDRIYDFSLPIATRDYTVFVRASDVGIQTLADLRGRKVGVPPVGIMRDVLAQQPELQLVRRAGFADAFRMLAAGEMDGLAAETWSAAYVAHQQGFRNVKMIEPPFLSGPVSIAVRQGDPMLSEIDAAIRALRADGTFENIEARWRSQQVVVMTREEQQRLIGFAIGSALLVLLLALAGWVITLKKHIRGRQRAEIARTEADLRLRLALTAADMGTWHWDAPTDQISRDASLNRMLGLVESESTSARSEFLARVHPEDRSAARIALDRAVKSQSPFAVEYRVIRPDGVVRWFRETGRPFPGTSGEVTYAAGVVVDVTAEREMATALRRSEERFAKAFQMSPDCIAISDDTGIIDINDRFEQITGYPKSMVLGRRLPDTGIMPDLARFEEFFHRMRTTGYVRDFEAEVISSTGIRRTLLSSGEPVELDGRQHYLTVSRDITAHKLAEEALRRTEVRYRELVENANDIIFTVDRDGYCLSMNRIGQLITGYVATDSRGIDLRKLVAPEEIPTVLRQLQRVMAGEDVKPFEIDVITADGRRITLEVGVRPLREDAAIIAAQGIARDVTTRRELEAQLRQAQKMDGIGRLAAGVAHDFNNLLTIILAHCESTAPIVPVGSGLQSAISGIKVAADRAASLTGQLLAFSRRQVTQPRPLDLNTVVSDIKVMMTRLIGEDIRVQFRPGDHLWTVSADSSQIQQVVLNLAVNARDAMPSGGDLIIETKNVMLDGQYVQHHAQVPPGEYVMISVSDSGIGMDQETLAHIFEPFFTTKEVGKGTGLGLATVYGIVKQSLGFVWVYSEVGIGSTFKVYLPRIDAQRPNALVPLKRADAASGSEKVLLVEDEADLREILQQYLESKGYSVLSASDGPSGLAACRASSPIPRLLITDVVMPGMSGRVLADQLRTEHPAIKVLYLSGYTDDAVLRHGILPNDTHFLQKPFALHDLAGKVRSILDTPQASA